MLSLARSMAFRKYSSSSATHISNLLPNEKNIILRGADVLSQRGFTQVPNYVLESERISPGAKLTYALLLKYAWHNDFCFPGQERLAKDMGVTRQSVNAYIKELRKKGFIAVKRQGQGRPNIYELFLRIRKTR